MNTIIRHLRQGIFAIAVGAAVAACGGSNSASTDTNDPASASAGTVVLSATAFPVNQRAGTVKVVVHRSGGSAGAVTIEYTTTNGTAVAGADFTATSGTLEWADGETTAKSVSIPISTANGWSGTKSFNVTLSNPSGGAEIGSPSAGSVEITGSGTAPGAASGALNLTASTYTVAQNAGTVVVKVSRTGGSSGAVGITYTTTDGTAAAGTDYTAGSGTLDWADGDSASKNITIAISNATPFTGSKTFMIALSAPTGGAAVGSPSSATVNIDGSSVATTPGTIALSASAYGVKQSAGSLLVTVNRNGGSSGAVSVHYATSDGTAAAGTNYIAKQGTLNWAGGASTAQTFSVTINASPVLTASKTFTITLSAAGGGAALGTSSATATINLASVSSGTSVRVQGNHLIDASGNNLQLRGADVSGLEFAPIDGSPGSDGWGGQKPNLSAIAAWKINALRIPLNEASYLGYMTYNANGSQHNPDPSGNYKQVVQQLVTDATALGMYVILDLHKNAPKGLVNGTLMQVAPQSATQNQMADADNSVAFWTAVANDFKDSPNVIFDLFNEPYFDHVIAPSGVTGTAVAWTILRDGGTNTLFYADNTTFTAPWTSAGMQAMLNAVRATGATNVVMTAGVSWAQDTSQWVQYAPVDPLKQLACSWHAYPGGGGLPGFGQSNYTWAAAILAAGYPIIIGETGDGSSNATLLPNLLPWADTHNVSVLAWTWNAWGSSDNDLITNANGTPTAGEGATFKAWTLNHP
ncbi:MAG: Calx-beta domain-containing protein [Gammaproteobacteria bacterium]